MKPIYLDYNLSSIANRRTSQHCDGKNIASLKEVNIELKELAATDRRHEHLPTLRVYYTPEKNTLLRSTMSGTVFRLFCTTIASH